MLGIETSTELVGAALLDEAGRHAESVVVGRRRHAEALAPAIEHVLAQAGMPLSSVTGLAVDIGPGLFTGLRVGVATAQGLAEGLGLEVWCATSLQVLARTALDDGQDGRVAAVVDARRGEVFAALYGRAPAGPRVRPGAGRRRRTGPRSWPRRSPTGRAARDCDWSVRAPAATPRSSPRSPVSPLSGGLSASPTPSALLTVVAEEPRRRRLRRCPRVRWPRCTCASPTPAATGRSAAPAAGP